MIRSKKNGFRICIYIKATDTDMIIPLFDEFVFRKLN